MIMGKLRYGCVPKQKKVVWKNSKLGLGLSNMVLFSLEKNHLTTASRWLANHLPAGCADDLGLWLGSNATQ